MVQEGCACEIDILHYMVRTVDMKIANLITISATLVTGVGEGKPLIGTAVDISFNGEMFVKMETGGLMIKCFKIIEPGFSTG